MRRDVLHHPLFIYLFIINVGGLVGEGGPLENGFRNCGCYRALLSTVGVAGLEGCGWGLTATLEVGNCTCYQEVGVGKGCDLERSKGSVQVLKAAASPGGMLASGLLCSLHSRALVHGNSSAFPNRK